MSVPAPSLAPAPVVPPVQRPRTTSAARLRPTNPPQSRRRARRGHPLVFWLFAGVLVSAMVVGIVTLNALAVQATYHMQVFRQEVSDLSTQQVQLTDQAAALSAPGRVATWAREHGMQAPGPGNTVVLRVRGFAGSDSGRSAP